MVESTHPNNNNEEFHDIIDGKSRNANFTYIIHFFIKAEILATSVVKEMKKSLRS